MRLRRGGTLAPRAFALGNVVFAPFGHDMPLAERDSDPPFIMRRNTNPARSRGQMMMEK